VQISRSILGEGCELKDYKTPRDVTVGKKETVAFDSSNVEKNESLKGTRNTNAPPAGIETLFVRQLFSKHMESRIRSEDDIDANVDAQPPHRQMFRDGEFSHRRWGPQILLSTVS